MMQLFLLIGKDFNQLSYLAKSSILDASQGLKYTSGISSNVKNKCWKSEHCKPIRFQCTLSLPPENIRKSYDFLMFSGGKERVHWEEIG